MIRPARTADAAAIATIWAPIVRDTTITFTTVVKSAADIEALIASARPFLVTEEEGTATGFALVQPFRSGPGYRFTGEQTIHLSPAARGRGQGRRLIEALCLSAGEAGWRSLWAGVSGENTAGIAFHAACGYATMAVLPEVGHKFGRPLDLVLMRRVLADLSSDIGGVPR